jgi:outer membrane protein assembly factor BamB
MDVSSEIRPAEGRDGRWRTPPAAAWAMLGVLSVELAMAGCGRPARAPAAAVPEASASETARESPAGGQDWPLFRGNPAATGVSESDLPEQLSLLWRHRVKQGAFGATAVIAQRRVYIGDLDGGFYSLDLDTGAERWRFRAGNGFMASAAVKGSLIYAGDMDGRFYCLDSEGNLKWRFETGAEIDSGANFYLDKVLVGSQDATLYCLSATSGQLAWKFAIEDQIRCSPTVARDRAFLAGCDGRLHIVDLTKGAAAASVDIEAPTGVTPAVQDDRVFFGTEGGVFFCVDWKRAAVVWRFEDAQGSQPYRSSAAVTQRRVVVGGRDRRIHALDPASGKRLWSFAAKRLVDSSPVIVGKRVFVGSADGRLYGLDLDTGAELWHYEAGGAFTSSPAAASGRLVIASDDGVVYCFGRKGNEGG